MEPTLAAGDVVFVDVTSIERSLLNDLDVVVARHPQQPNVEIVKRVSFIESNGVYLLSDNAEDPTAADSRRFGLVPMDNLVGRVISKLERDEPH